MRGQRPSAEPVYVLVIEDDESAREVLCGTLVAEGFEARGVADVQQALAQLAERVPDVVITDLHLGANEGGEALACHVRGTAAMSSMGLIAISGAVEPDWQIVRHFDAYLRKPVDVDTLVGLLTPLGRNARRGRNPAADAGVG